MIKAIASCFILIMILILCPVAAQATEGDTGTDGYFSWRELADGTVEVTDYSYLGPRDVVIPDTLSGRTVSAIGQTALNMDTIESVALPDSVTAIGNQAFNECYYLTSISLGSGLKSIGEFAFYRSGLASLTLPDSLETIGNAAFMDCTYLASVTFGGSLQAIGAGAFRNCKFTSVTLPDSLEFIGSSAFLGNSLTSVVFGSHLASIGDNAFAQCPINVPLLFPDSLQTIGNSAFYECTSLTAVTFGSGLVSIEDSAFCFTGLVSAALPDSLLTIGIGAFGSCPNLTAVTFGSGLESIGDAAFHQAPIEAAVLPDSLKTIGEGAFYECTSLTAVTFGNGLESIGRWAFSHSGVTSVTLPASLQTLGPWAFYNSLSLDKIVILNRTIPLHAGAFLGCPVADGIWGFAGSTAQSTYTYYPFHYMYAVSFNTSGGSAVDDVVVEEGGTILQPTEPSWTLHIFGGWFENVDCTQPVIFPYTPSSDTTLYAKWTSIYTVVFDSNGGSSIASQSVIAGGKATEPADPERANYVFGGWYADAALADMWDFDTDTVSGDTTLYAKWTELTLSSSDADGKIYTGGRVTLTPSVAGGIWTFDSAYFSREGNTFTALESGTSTITYTAGGVSTTYNVTIEESELPATGQDFAWVIVSAGLSIITLLAAILIRAGRRKTHYM